MLQVSSPKINLYKHKLCLFPQGLTVPAGIFEENQSVLECVVENHNRLHDRRPPVMRDKLRGPERHSWPRFLEGGV